MQTYPKLENIPLANNKFYFFLWYTTILLYLQNIKTKITGIIDPI